MRGGDLLSPLLPFAGAKRATGLDIGTTFIKAVELRKTGNKVEITCVGVHPTPEGTIINGSVLDPARAASAVKEALREGGIRSREVYAAIAGDDVVVRHVVFPRMPKEELAQAVKWDAGSYIPYPTKDASIDFQLVGPATESGDKVEVMIVAAPKKLVGSHLETMELAGVYPVALDIQPITLDRVFGRGESGGAGFYADIGGGTTDIAYSEDGVLRFTRMVGIGGNDFTAAVAEATGGDASWAEMAKRKASLSRPVADTFGGEQGEKVSPSDVQIGRALSQVASELALEIRRSIDYCNAQARARRDGDSPITCVTLTGGGSRLAGLPEFLQDSLGIAVRLGDPMRNVVLAPGSRLAEVISTYGPSLSVAIGLALRGVEAA